MSWMTQVKGGDNVEMFALQQTINDYSKMETICNLYLIYKVESQQGVCNTLQIMGYSLSHFLRASYVFDFPMQLAADSFIGDTY